MSTSPNPETLCSQSMDVDESSVVARRFNSVPLFLRRVLREELAEDRSNQKLLVIALHAALLESGFVRFDSVSGSQMDPFHLPGGWPATDSTLSMSYTLPEILQNQDNGGDGTEAVVLRTQTLRHMVNVYGCLRGGSRSEIYRVCLDELKFAPMLDFVWQSRNVSDTQVFLPEREILELWKIVKDELVYPLLIDICAKAGLSGPASFMSLPLELKTKILEMLPGADVAKLECTCKELQILASSNDELWKHKFWEELGEGSALAGQWKIRFKAVKRLRVMKRRRMARNPAPIIPDVPPFVIYPEFL